MFLWNPTFMVVISSRILTFRLTFFSAIVELGCVCEVLPPARVHDVTAPWTTTQLERKESRGFYLGMMRERKLSCREVS
jgi:hypothetical protein